MHAHVTEVAALPEGTALTLDVGAANGVATWWEGNVLGPADNPIAPLVILKVEDHVTYARTALDASKVSTRTVVALGRGKDAPPPLTCETYDPKNPACKGDPRFGDGKCPSPPDYDNPFCQGQLPCPDPPDRRIRACHVGHDVAPGPVVGRVIKLEVQGGSTIVTISAGSDQGVAKDWSGVVLAGDSDQKLVDVEILRIAKRQTVARVPLPAKDIEANPRVRLTPPP